MKRLIQAYRNSAAAFGHLLRNETAFKQECVLFLIAVPAGFFVARDLAEYFVLLSAIAFIVLIEVLNTAIEAVCDALTPEFDPNIKIAKDCGSLAVLLACAIAFIVWMLALINLVTG